MEKRKIKLSVKPAQPIRIQGAHIALDAFLKLCNAAESGGAAKQAIQGGQVRHNGEICTHRSKKLRPGDSVVFAGAKYVVTGSEQAMHRAHTED
ncbi:MAG: RNA-binding S4 domain-containing protein [Oscillospiraceae bacterium]|nr:RNA-binding S4 domain-containing protein [Oscillospiraceae bacterium]